MMQAPGLYIATSYIRRMKAKYRLKLWLIEVWPYVSCGVNTLMKLSTSSVLFVFSYLSTFLQFSNENKVVHLERK